MVLFWFLDDDVVTENYERGFFYDASAHKNGGSSCQWKFYEFTDVLEPFKALKMKNTVALMEAAVKEALNMLT